MVTLIIENVYLFHSEPGLGGVSGDSSTECLTDDREIRYANPLCTISPISPWLLAT